MAVKVYQLPKPYIEISLVAGGSLTVGQEYFFIGYFNNGMGYYANAVGIPSDEISITPTSGNQSIKLEWWVYQNEIQSFSDAGGGQLTVTSLNHGKNDGDSVHIGKTVNYNGDYVISNVTIDTFEITATWVSTEIGILAWQKGLPNFTTRYEGIIFKWDKYSMLRPDGSYYQWFNLNDPNVNTFTGGDEYFISSTIGRRGHRKWSTRYYADGFTGDEITFTQEESVTGYDKLLDGEVVGTTVIGQMNHPTIAYNKIERPSIYNNSFNFERGRLLIKIDGVGNTVDDLITELQNGDFDDMYTLVHTPTYLGYAGKNILQVAGHMSGQIGAEITIDDIALTLVGGSLGYKDIKTYATRSELNLIGIQYSTNLTFFADLTDCSVLVDGVAFILDFLDTENSNPRGKTSIYANQKSGLNLIGGYPFAPKSFNWRYQRRYNSPIEKISKIENFLLKQYFLYIEERSGDIDVTGYLTDIKFENDGFSYIYDVRDNFGGYVISDTNQKMRCLNVTSNRNNGILKIFWYKSSSNNITDIWEFAYKLNFYISDKDNNPIGGALIVVDGYELNSDSTDIFGNVSIEHVNYTIEYDSADTDGEGLNSKSTLDIQSKITVSKSGYEDFILENFTTLENTDFNIVLKEIESCNSINIDQQNI